MSKMRDIIRVWLFIVLAACLCRAVDLTNVYNWVLFLEDASKNFNSPGYYHRRTLSKERAPGLILFEG